MRFTLIVSLLLSILAVIFALQNPQQAEVQLGTIAFEGSTALILIVTFALGVLVGVLGALPGWLRNRRKVSSLQKTIAEREAAGARHRETTTPPAESSSETRRKEPPADTDATGSSSKSSSSPSTKE